MKKINEYKKEIAKFKRILNKTQIAKAYKNNLIELFERFITSNNCLFLEGCLNGKINAFWFMDLMKNKQKDDLIKLIRGIK